MSNFDLDRSFDWSLEPVINVALTHNGLLRREVIATSFRPQCGSEISHNLNMIVINGQTSHEPLATLEAGNHPPASGRGNLAWPGIVYVTRSRTEKLHSAGNLVVNSHRAFCSQIPSDTTIIIRRSRTHNLRTPRQTAGASDNIV
jgi:hypothetical protein